MKQQRVNYKMEKEEKIKEKHQLFEINKIDNFQPDEGKK